MAHKEQRDFLETVRNNHPEWFTEVSVLEVGSLDINGTVRDFFHNVRRYVGVDVGPGPGVDVVENGENLDYGDDEFDIAISAECFEHNPEWIATFANMHRMAKTAVIFTCASEGRPEHGTTRSHPDNSPFTIAWDYYRNLNAEDFEQAFDLDGMFTEYAFDYNPNSHDLYFWGIKKTSTGKTASNRHAKPSQPRKS